MRIQPRRFAVLAVAPLTASAALPATAANGRERHHSPSHPSSGGLSAVIRYTEYGIPHILAKNYADLGFGTGWAQAADQVCTLADGFVTVRGERPRFFGPDAEPDGSLSSAAENLSSDLCFRGVRATGTVEKLLAEPAPRSPSRGSKELMRGRAAGGYTEVTTGVLVHPGRRAGRRPLPGRPYAADLLPVVEPELAALRRPDTAVLRGEVGHLPVLREGHRVLTRAAGDPRGRAPLTAAGWALPARAGPTPVTPRSDVTPLAYGPPSGDPAAAACTASRSGRAASTR